MTALDQYIRLEAPGRWRETEKAEWREVLVSFGNATLVLSDFSEAPLTHWSLAAVERLGTGTPAVYRPDAGTREVLEVDDPTMIEAIEEVSKLARINNRGTPRRRLRWPIGLTVVLTMLAAAALWGPGWMRDRAFALITPEQAELLSDRMRPALPGRACRTPEGLRALRAVVSRLSPGVPVEVRDWQAPRLARLPDGTVLLGRGVAEEAGSAEEVAGWIAAAVAAGPETSPLYRWTRGLDLKALGQFLSTGEVPGADLRALAADIAAQEIAVSEPVFAKAATALGTRSISSAPLAAALGYDAPVADAEEKLVLPRDRDWVALQNICAG